MLTELLENSKKFHPSHLPRITVEISRSDDKYVQIRFTDNGSRLLPEQIDQVCNPYYQGGKIFTGQVDGTGLGLPMVASVLWEAGGSCQIYNRLSSPGVVVVMKLPIVTENLIERTQNATD
jgi:K+-sensing histidine kinase KdpD